MLHAVIDIGSTSVRLMLTDGVRVAKSLNTTRLAEKMGQHNILQPINLERTAQAVAEFFYKAVERGAEDVYIFATEAVRSAKNKASLIYRVRELCGEEIEILSKDEEAYFGFLGAYTKGVCCVIDMGGASTEIAVGNSQGLLFAASIPYGIVRLTNLEEKGIELYPFVKQIVSGLDGVPQFDEVIAIGGTASTMASMKEQLKVFDPNVTNGCRISVDEIEKTYKLLKPMSLEERKHIQGLPEKRADIITSGLLMYGLLLKKLNTKFLTVSEGDNLEGYLIAKGILPNDFKAVYATL